MNATTNMLWDAQRCGKGVDGAGGMGHHREFSDLQRITDHGNVV